MNRNLYFAMLLGCLPADERAVFGPDAIGREPWMPSELRDRPRVLTDEDRRRLAAAQAKRERKAAKRRSR